MKYGAILDTENFNQHPWIILFLNHMMDKMDQEEVEGAFQPKNLGHGWMHDVLDKEDAITNRQEEKTFPSVIQNSNQ